ncbi:MAG: PEP-CTERM sorting domain-containing protein [Verrucomicrobiota bacterium]
MKIRVPSLLLTLGVLNLATAASHAAINYVQITGDADSGIASSNTYTHALDFGTGSPGALINGVQFSAYPNSANGTLNFLRTVSSGSENDNPGNGGHNVTGDLANLMTDMIYNGNNAVGGTTLWTLSGLTAGVTYDARIYTRQWASPSDRSSTLVFDPDGAGAISESTSLINEDDALTVGMPAANTAYYINYRFTAVAGQNLVITATQSNLNQSWHLYGLSNQVVPEPSTTAFAGLVGLGLLARRRRK